jgi:hypothetical protein
MGSMLSRTDDAARTLIASGETVVESFAGTNEKIRVNVTQIVDRLSQSNEMLQQLLSASSNNLSKIETNLAVRSDEFAQDDPSRP